MLSDSFQTTIFVVKNEEQFLYHVTTSLAWRHPSALQIYIKFSQYNKLFIKKL